MKIIFGFFLMIAFSANAKANDLSRINYLPSDGVVKNSEIAISLAKITLISVYGDSQIKKQLPLNARLINHETWLISGTFNEPSGSLGGVAEILLRKRDGAVLGMIHGK